MASDSDYQKNSQFLLGFLLGALIGAATALFSDTTKGTALRKNLVKKAKEALKDLPSLLDPLDQKQLTQALTQNSPLKPKASSSSSSQTSTKTETSTKGETLARVRRFFKRNQKTKSA